MVVIVFLSRLRTLYALFTAIEYADSFYRSRNPILWALASNPSRVGKRGKAEGALRSLVGKDTTIVGEKPPDGNHPLDNALRLGARLERRRTYGKRVPAGYQSNGATHAWLNLLYAPGDLDEKE